MNSQHAFIAYVYVTTSTFFAVYAELISETAEPSGVCNERHCIHLDPRGTLKQGHMVSFISLNFVSVNNIVFAAVYGDRSAFCCIFSVALHIV